MARSWVARTDELAGFRFTAKAHRSLTHEPENDPAAAVEATLRGLRPLRDAGRLGALLLQFPHAFHFTTASTLRVERLLAYLEGWPVSVEVRHASWRADAAENWLRGLDVGWCAVDQPVAGRSTLPVLPRVTGSPAYLRLHGRNAADWFRPGAGRDARYDYLYSEGELRRLVEPAKRMADAAESLFVVQNNHFRGKALVNALQFRGLLCGSRPDAPDHLVAAYPDLEPHVHVERTRLF